MLHIKHIIFLFAFISSSIFANEKAFIKFLPPLSNDYLKINEAYYSIDGTTQSINLPCSVPVGGDFFVDVGLENLQRQIRSVLLEDKNKNQLKGDKVDKKGNLYKIKISRAGDFRLIISTYSVIKKEIIPPKFSIGIASVDVFIDNKKIYNGDRMTDNAKITIEDDIILRIQIKNGYGLKIRNGAKMVGRDIVIPYNVIKFAKKIDLNNFYEVVNYVKTRIDFVEEPNIKNVLDIKYQIKNTDGEVIEGRNINSISNLSGEYLDGEEIYIWWYVLSNSSNGHIVISQSNDNGKKITGVFPLENNFWKITVGKTNRQYNFNLFNLCNIPIDEKRGYNMENYKIHYDFNCKVGDIKLIDFFDNGVVPIDKINMKVVANDGFEVVSNKKNWYNIFGKKAESGISKYEFQVDLTQWKQEKLSLRDFILEKFEKNAKIIKKAI